jgi:hypothetical protein
MEMPDAEIRAHSVQGIGFDPPPGVKRNLKYGPDNSCVMPRAYCAVLSRYIVVVATPCEYAFIPRTTSSLNWLTRHPTVAVPYGEIVPSTPPVAPGGPPTTAFSTA